MITKSYMLDFYSQLCQMSFDDYRNSKVFFICLGGRQGTTMALKCVNFWCNRNMNLYQIPLVMWLSFSFLINYTVCDHVTHCFDKGFVMSLNPNYPHGVQVLQWPFHKWVQCVQGFCSFTAEMGCIHHTEESFLVLSVYASHNAFVRSMRKNRECRMGYHSHYGVYHVAKWRRFLSVEAPNQRVWSQSNRSSQGAKKLMFSVMSEIVTAGGWQECGAGNGAVILTGPVISHIIKPKSWFNLQSSMHR